MYSLKIIFIVIRNVIYVVCMPSYYQELDCTHILLKETKVEVSFVSRVNMQCHFSSSGLHTLVKKLSCLFFIWFILEVT